MIEESIREATLKSAKEAQDMLRACVKELATTLKDSKYNANDLLAEEQVADYLGVSVKTLRQWRSDKKFIPYVKVGNAPRYKFIDILEYVNRSKILVTGC